MFDLSDLELPAGIEKRIKNDRNRKRDSLPVSLLDYSIVSNVIAASSNSHKIRSVIRRTANAAIP